MASRPDPLQAYTRYSNIGLEFVAYIIVAVAIGYGIDVYTQPSKPWGILACSLLGCGGAMWQLIRRLNELSSPPKPDETPASAPEKEGKT